MNRGNLQAGLGLLALEYSLPRIFPVRAHLCLFLVLWLQAKRRPKVGDLVEIFRPDFQHWAVYVGDGYVVHVTPPGKDRFVFKHKGGGGEYEQWCAEGLVLTSVAGVGGTR